MSPDDRRRLEWIVNNRSRRSRVSQVGSAVEKVVTAVEQRGLEPALIAVQALAPIVDDEFRRHCRVAGAVDGRMTIHVDVAPLVSVMRMKWLGAIRKGLRSVDRRLSEGAIVFELGQFGVEIPPT